MPFQKNEGNSRWNILYGQFRFFLERIMIVREGTEERTKSARFVVLCDIRLRYIRKPHERINMRMKSTIVDPFIANSSFRSSVISGSSRKNMERVRCLTIKSRIYQFLQFHILESLNFDGFAIKQFYSWKLLTSFQIRKFVNLEVCSLKDSQCSSWKC